MEMRSDTDRFDPDLDITEDTFDLDPTEDAPEELDSVDMMERPVGERLVDALWPMEDR